MRSRAIRVLLAVLVGAASAAADTIWDEAADGVLSDSGSAPTSVALVSSCDSVSGIGDASSGWLTFTVPAGELVYSMVINPGPSGVSIMNLYSGATSAGTLLCSPYPSTQTDLLDGTTCTDLTDLAPGDYTLEVMDKMAVAWTLTMFNTIDTRVFADGFESGDTNAWGN